MGFLDLFRPKWRHSDPEVRAEAVRHMDDAVMLARVLELDDDVRVRRIAVKKIDDLDVLLLAAERDRDAGVREAARDKAAGRLLGAAVASDEGSATRALGRLTGERDLATVARTAALPEVRRAALARVHDDKLLADIARRADDGAVRLAAVARIGDAKVLEDLAKNESTKAVAAAATARISDGAALATLARGAKSPAVRNAARARLEGVSGTAATTPIARKKGGPAPADAKAKKALLLQICLAAESAVRMADLAAAERTMAEALARWDDVDQVPGTEALSARFARAAKEVAERRAREEHHHELEARRREEKRAREAAEAAAEVRAREEAAAPVEEKPPAAPDPEAERRAEARARRDEENRARRDAKEQARRDEDELRARRDEELKARRDAERTARLGALARALPELEALVAAEPAADLKTVEKALKDLQGVVRARPGADADLAPDDRELAAKVAGLYDRLAAQAAELRDAERWRRWVHAPKPEELCQEAEALAQVLADTEDKRRAPAILKELQAKWRHAVGTAPTPKTQGFWTRFQAAVEACEQQLREHFAKLDASRGDNLARKEALCVEAEGLADSTAWKATAERLKALQAEWKAIGPVPTDQADAVWKRFRAACDKFFEARKANEKVLDVDRRENLAAKEKLCERAEALSGSSEWRDTADKLKALQEEWESIGAVPRDQADAVWKRFRAACDKFFDARKAAFAEADAERTANLAHKLELCAQAEALAETVVDDPEGALDKVKGLQAEWKRIGHVPREQSDAIWKRFRAACDLVYSGPPMEDLPPDAAAATGTAGFVNRLPLEKVAAQLAQGQRDDEEDDGPPEKTEPTVDPSH